MKIFKFLNLVLIVINIFIFIVIFGRDLSTRQKVEVLYDMCNWRIELEDAMELTKVF